jgi:hypothetical protein
VTAGGRCAPDAKAGLIDPARGQEATFGRGGDAYPVDIRLADSAVSRLAGPLRATEVMALNRIVENSEEFLRTWPRTPALHRMDPDEVRKLLTFDDVDRMLVDNGLRFPSFGMEKSSHMASDRSITKRALRSESDVRDTADSLSISHHQQEGYSLSLHNVQAFSGPLGEFCDRLGYEIGSPVTVTSFLSPPNSRALIHHHDTVDLFICQTEGEKTFRLYTPIVTDALDHQRWSWSYVSDEDRTRLVDGHADFEFTLTPGSVLWIPRGWIHEANAGPSISLHVTLRVESATEYWLAETVMRWLADTQGLRGNLPMAFSSSKSQCAAAVKDGLARISNLMADCDMEELAEYVQQKDHMRFLGPRIRPIRDVLLGQSQDLGGCLYLRAEGAVGRRWDGEVLVVHLGSAERAFSGSEAQLLDELLTDEPKEPIYELLQQRLGADAGDALARKLLASGLARVPGGGDRWRFRSTRE